MVDWQSLTSQNHKGTAIYTASWTAPVGPGVHSKQHFYYMAEKGEININQAQRGYDVAVDEQGVSWINPFYMKYTPDEAGFFDGQTGYGYISIEKFVEAARKVSVGIAKANEFDNDGFPTIRNTIITTAILNAGRISLDEKRPVGIKNLDGKWVLE